MSGSFIHFSSGARRQGLTKESFRLVKEVQKRTGEDTKYIKSRVSLSSDAMLVHEVDERLRVLPHIWMEQNLVHRRDNFALVEQNFKVGDRKVGNPDRFNESIFL